MYVYICIYFIPECLSYKDLAVKHFLSADSRVCVFVAQSCLILCNPMDQSPPGSSVHRIS